MTNLTVCVDLLDYLHFSNDAKYVYKNIIFVN